MKLSYLDVLTYIDDVINNPEINEPFLEIVEFKNISNFDFGYYQSGSILSKLKCLANLNNYQGSILVVNSDLLKGMSNIFKVKGETQEVNVVPVTSFDEALRYVENYFS